MQSNRAGRTKGDPLANGTLERNDGNSQPQPEEPFIDPLTNPINDPLTNPIVDPIDPSLPPDDIPQPPNPSPGPTIPLDPNIDVIIDPIENPSGEMNDPKIEVPPLR
jgi:hypothetical protein